jgi:hypothetical protein
VSLLTNNSALHVYGTDNNLVVELSLGSQVIIMHVVMERGVLVLVATQTVDAHVVDY